MSNTITIKDPNGNIVCSVESVTSIDKNKTLFDVADFKDIPENKWAKEWIYVKDLDNNSILVKNKYGVEKIFSFDKQNKKPFIHTVDELDEFNTNSVESVTSIDKNKTLFDVADFKDIPENKWAKEWIYVKDLDNNSILVKNKYGVEKIFSFDKQNKKPFIHTVDELDEFNVN